MEDKLTLYGMPGSPPFRSVEIFTKLSGINYEFQEISIPKGEHRTEEYTRINPFQLIPAIKHNGFSVWESCAIVQYLADAYNVDNQWYPKTLTVRARINSYFHWHHMNVRDVVAGYARAKVVGPRFYGFPPLTEEREVVFRQQMVEFFSTFTWLISSTGYVARTERPTIADIFAFNELLNAKAILNLSIESYPEVERWYNEIQEITAVQESSDVALKSMAEIGFIKTN